jgi:sulfoxide reductase heme-binding subunit YedZ
LVKPALFALCLAPLAWLGWQWWAGGLGANPIEATTRFLGDWALRLLLVALAVTPARELSGWPRLASYRRMLGLFAFFYATLHVGSYVVLDQFFAWAEIAADIAKRTHISVGFTAFAVLAALAATSPAAVIKRLGAARWKRLHRLVYAAGALACLHYFMMVKADTGPPLVHAAVLAVLLGYRLWRWLTERMARASAALSRPAG